MRKYLRNLSVAVALATMLLGTGLAGTAAAAAHFRHGTIKGHQVGVAWRGGGHWNHGGWGWHNGGHWNHWGWHGGWGWRGGWGPWWGWGWRGGWGYPYYGYPYYGYPNYYPYSYPYSYPSYPYPY